MNLDQIRKSTVKLRKQFTNAYYNVNSSLRRVILNKKTQSKKQSYYADLKPVRVISKEELNKKAEFHMRLSRLFSLTVVSIIAGCLFLSYLLFVDKVDSKDKHTIIVKIPKNTPVYEIIEKLQSNKLIRHPKLFRLGLKVFKADKQLHAGVFDLSRNMTLKQVIDALTEKSGPASLVSFTIPEGYSLIEIADKLEENDILAKDEFLKYTKHGALGALASEYEFINDNPISSLEGYLYPDTYKFVRGISAHQIVKIMVDRFDQKIYKYFKKNKSQAPIVRRSLTFDEILTLASIIEKEAVVPNERKIISGVFVNRLKKRMVLAACPTVKYALGKPRKKLLDYKDVEVKSPYNTYRNAWLPPGPIASPGLESFKAAMFPEKTPYLFFIAKGDGTHVFSRTSGEHERLRRGNYGYNVLK